MAVLKNGPFQGHHVLHLVLNSEPSLAGQIVQTQCILPMFFRSLTAGGFKFRHRNEKLTKQRVEATKKLLDTINPILVDYSKEKSIAMIVQKKNIVIGKSELDITDDIIELVNKKISTIKLN